jgi:hypothetical protein
MLEVQIVVWISSIGVNPEPQGILPRLDLPADEKIRTREKRALLSLRDLSAREPANLFYEAGSLNGNRPPRHASFDASLCRMTFAPSGEMIISPRCL